MDKNKFKFYFPADILKATDPKTGEVEMKFKGIASSPGRDSQGEYLDPSGFDLTSFRWINYNHKGKDDPATLIGEPTLAKVTPTNELYIEGVLYSGMPMAVSTFQLMNALQKSPSGNKLSMSVEGKVIERDPKNPKRILKSKITAVALCPTPINGDTWADVITKGVTEESEEEYDEETKKAIQAEGSVTSKESVEHNVKDLTNKTLRKSDIYDRIFKQYPDIDIEKAKSVYKLIEKIATMEKEAKTVSDETIKKSFEILNLASEEIVKADNNKEAEKKEDKKDKNEDEEDDKDMYEKAYSSSKEMKKGGSSKEEMKAKLIKKGYGESVINKAIEKAMGDNEVVSNEETAEVKKSLDTLIDIVKSQSSAFDLKFKAIGEIMKVQSEENAELKKSLDDTLLINAELKKDIDKALSQPAGRKSLSTKSFSEKFEKSEDGKNVYNIKSNTDIKALKDRITDLSGINKSDNSSTGTYDKGLMKMAQNLELTKSLTQQDLIRLESFDIKVVTQG